MAGPGLSASLLLLATCYILTANQQVHTQQQQQTTPRSPCPRAFKINTNYRYRNTLHFICLQGRPNSRPQLDVIQYNNLQTIVSVPVAEMDTNQMASFVDEEGTLRVLVAVPGRINGTSMYSIDADGRYLNETHTINTQLVSTMSIWKLELNWEWHLATANQPYVARAMVDAGARLARKPIPDIGPMITIHSWRMSYFDKYQTIALPFDGHVNKLEPMHINDQEFLIVAMESHRQESGYSLRQTTPRTDSMIYKLDFSDGSLNWAKYQNLGTRHAIDVSSFVITHKGSMQRDYYIALVGQGEPSYEASNGRYSEGDGLSGEHGLIVYKYLGDRFMKTHAIAAPGATRIDTLSYGTGDNYVIVALMSGWSKQISLFLFDGLNLTPAPAPSMPMLRPPAPQYQRQAGAAVGRYQRTSSSDGFRLFNMPPPPPPVEDTINGTMKRTLSEGPPQSLAMPALVFSTAQDDASSDEAYGTGAAAANATQDVLYQLPISQMIAENEAKLSQPLGGLEAGYSKRNLAGLAPAQDLLGWCKTRIASILSDSFEPSAQLLATLPRVDQQRPIQIQGDLVIEGDLHISNLLYVSEVEDLSGRSVAINRQPMDFSQTFNALEQAAHLDAVRNRVEQILVDDGTIQDVYSPLRFDKLIFECMNQINVNPRLQQLPFVSATSCPQVGGVQAVWLNARDISDIRRQALLTGRSMQISQDIRFEHLVLRGRTSILDSLNGLRIEEIVFKQGHSTGAITGHKNLLSGLYTSANLLVGSWNGNPVDRQTFLTSNGEQRIESDLRFNHVIIDRHPAGQNVSSRIEILNGLHLDTHLEQIAQTDRINQFDVPVAFEELIIQGPAHFGASSLLSSIDLEEVWRSAMFKHSHQNVSAPMEFAGDVHVSYGGDLLIGPSINGVALGPNNVLLRNRDYDLLNPMVFEGDLSARSLQVEKHLNGIQALLNYETGQNELAIMYNTGNQFLTGNKILDEIKLGGQSHIRGAINGHLNLTQLYNLVRNNGEPYRFGRVRVKGADVRIADNAHLHVSSHINGIQANNICMLANRLAQAPAGASEQYDRLRFHQPVSFVGSLRCASINGFNDLQESFLMREGQQRVAGTLKLVQGVVLNSTVHIGQTFNSLTVGSLAQTIKQLINESQTGHKNFHGDLYVDELSAMAINELPLAQVFVANTDQAQTISAPMVFDHLDIENVLVIGQDLYAHSFNGLNVSDILSNTLQYDAPQVIYNHVELAHLHILPGANLATNSVNGHDLRRVYADSVLIDRAQQILAPKIFTGQVDLSDRVFLRFGIDGLAEDELKFILLLQSDELIEDDLEFNNDVSIMKSLEIQSSLINDVDVNMFVASMLSEQRQNNLRLLGNSSLRFKDVQLNNLVVTGTIQGLDLSREALLLSDNLNGTYSSRLREHQVLLANQRIFNNLYHNQRQEFPVQTKYRNEQYGGACRIHSCPQTTPLIPMDRLEAPRGPPAANQPAPTAPLAPGLQAGPRPGAFPYSSAPWQLPYRPGTSPLPAAEALLAPTGPSIQQQQQQQHVIHSPVILPRPMNMLLVNTTQVGPVWRPQPQTHLVLQSNGSADQRGEQNFALLVDPKYLEYQAMLKAQAIGELSARVNKYLTVSFYYEIVQRHHLLGPVLHAAQSPLSSQASNVWLLSKATVKEGEPCLQRGQKIDVLAESPQKGFLPRFAISSHIQETSNPSKVESLAVGPSRYVFISDSYPDGPSETSTRLLVYEWDYSSGMYNPRQSIHVDGAPTALRAFAINQIGCIALANPRVLQSNHSGAPLLYCQFAPNSEFSVRTILPLSNIFELDIIVLPASGEFVVAALSQPHTEQVGDLVVVRFELATMGRRGIATRRTARPLKVHFVKQAKLNGILLAVSEGITSNDAAQATTRIFALHLGQGPHGRLLESQIIRDNQFTDIQSVLLDSRYSMIFLQSTHSISIYAPLGGGKHSGDSSCDSQFALIQRLPTKGANKFLVFNDNLPANSSIPSSIPQSHVLILSKDDCEHQQYSTLLLKPKFR